MASTIVLGATHELFDQNRMTLATIIMSAAAVTLVPLAVVCFLTWLYWDEPEVRVVYTPYYMYGRERGTRCLSGALVFMCVQPACAHAW